MSPPPLPHVQAAICSKPPSHCVVVFLWKNEDIKPEKIAHIVLKSSFWWFRRKQTNTHTRVVAVLFYLATPKLLKGHALSAQRPGFVRLGGPFDQALPFTTGNDTYIYIYMLSPPQRSTIFCVLRKMRRIIARNRCAYAGVDIQVQCC